MEKLTERTRHAVNSEKAEEKEGLTRIEISLSLLENPD